MTDEPTLLQRFRADVEDFLTSTGMAPTVFGREAVRDPNFVFELREGRAPNLALVDRVMSFMRDQKERAA